MACVCLEEQFKTYEEDTREANSVWGGGCMQQAGGECQQANEIHGKKPSGHIMDLYWSCEYQKIMTICLFLFQKVNCGPVRRGRRTTGLKVAMTFPAKKTGKRPASEPLPQNKVQDSESEEEENFIVKRALNIKENKEMVLFDACFLLYHCCGSWTLTADRFWHLYTSLSFSLQSLWQSWTKSPDSSPDECRCLHPLR